MKANKSRLLCGVFGALVTAAAFAGSYDGPPLTLLPTNVLNTPYTAYIVIDSIKVVRETKNSRTGEVSLVTFQVQATVAETIKGIDYGHVEYLETRETPSEGPRPGSRLVVSLDEDKDGVLFVPDNGYVFPATTEVLQLARNLARSGKRVRGTLPVGGATPDSRQ